MSLQKLWDAGKKITLAAMLAGCSVAYSGEVNNAPIKVKQPQSRKTLDEKIAKMPLPKKFLIDNDNVWKRILTFEKDGTEYLQIPGQLLDGELTETNPELKRAEIVEKVDFKDRSRSYSLRRFYNILEDGRKQHFQDEKPLDVKVVDKFMDYYQRKGFHKSPKYRHSMNVAGGADLSGPYFKFRYRRRFNTDSAVALSAKIQGGDDYEVDLELATKGQSIILSRSKDQVEGIGNIPNFQRTEWNLAHLLRNDYSATMVRVGIIDEEAENKKDRGKKLGDWKDGEYNKVEVGESFVTDKNLGYMYVLGHDGRDPGMLFSVSYRGKNDDHAKSANNMIMMRKLYSRNHDSVTIGKHSVKGVVDAGYWHGSPVFEGTVYTMGGELALIPVGYGRSTDTYPMEKYGKPGSSYSAIVFGPSTIISAVKKMTGAKEPEYYEPSVWKEMVNSISLKLIMPWNDGGVTFVPQINRRNMEMSRQNDAKR